MTPISPAGPFQIEPAGPQGADAIAGLHAGLFDTPWSASSIREMLQHPGSIAFLAQAGDPAVPAGFILGQVAADEAELLSVGVAPALQGHGLGRCLLKALCEAARAAGANRLYLEVAAGNAPALALYAAFSAQEIGRRRAYYQRAGALPEDALNLAIPF